VLWRDFSHNLYSATPPSGGDIWEEKVSTPDSAGLTSVSILMVGRQENEFDHFPHLSALSVPISKGLASTADWFGAGRIDN
jgi:hypothetical protein